MVETEKSYVAGYLEAKNFRPAFSKGTWQIVTSVSLKNSRFIRKVARLTGAKIYESQTQSLSDNFIHMSRPAVYRDGISPKLQFYIAGKPAQKLILSISKYLSPETIKRFEPLIKHHFILRKKSIR